MVLWTLEHHEVAPSPHGHCPARILLPALAIIRTFNAKPLSLYFVRLVTTVTRSARALQRGSSTLLQTEAKMSSLFARDAWRAVSMALVAALISAIQSIGAGLAYLNQDFASFVELITSYNSCSLK